MRGSPATPPPPAAARASASGGLTAAEQAAGVLKKGRLLKQGGLVRSWRERWFVLFSDRLVYFEPTEYDSSAPLAVAASRARGALPLAAVTGVAALRARGAFCVSVGANAASGVAAREYLLVASGDVERRAWVDALQRACLAPSRAALVLRAATDALRRDALSAREASDDCARECGAVAEIAAGLRAAGAACCAARD
jgi:hypothetical protein